MTTPESLDDFLSYTSSNKAAYLGNWKDDGSVTIWLHKHLAPKRVWRHGLKRIVLPTKDKPAAIWTDRYVCLEQEDVLKDQYRFERLTGRRQVAPRVCPNCLFGEYVRGLILTGKIHWLDPVLKYETDEESIIICAQGLIGYPKPDKLSDEQKRELRAAGVTGNTSWQEDQRPKLNWIFTAVEHKHPEKGIQIDIETQALGDRVRKQIKKAMEVADLKEPGAGWKGNPLLNPYPIKFSYNDAKDVPFGDKYDATALEGISPSEEILALLDSEPPRDAVERLMQHPDLASLRKNLEQHTLIPGVPWDQIFSPAYELYKANNWPIEAKEEVEETHSNRLGEVVTGAGTCDCDHCGKPMLLTESVCPHCRFDYDPKPAQEVPLVPRKTRSQMLKESMKPAQPKAPDAPTSKVTVDIDPLFPKTEDDGIPF
jgi:hypothetical protein